MATLNNTTYTQINTDTAAFTIQYTGSSEIGLILADTQPGDDDKPTAIMTKGCGPTQSLGEGIVWGKILGGNYTTVEVIPYSEG